MSDYNLDLKKLNKILVGVDDSPDSQLAFKVSINQALQNDAELDLVTIVEEDDMNVYEVLNRDYLNDKREIIESKLQDYKKIAEDAGIKVVKTFIAEGEVGETIIKDVIPDIKPDLLVIGASSRTGLSKYFGSQAGYMSKNSPISTLVIR